MRTDYYKDRAKALNTINKFLSDVQGPISKLFPEGDGSMYNQGLILNKRTSAAVRAIFNEFIPKHDKHFRVHISTTVSVSVSVDTCIRVNDENSTSVEYIKNWLAICTAYDLSSGRYNIRDFTTTSDFPVNMTASKLKAMATKLEKLEQKATEIRGEISNLRWYLGG